MHIGQLFFDDAISDEVYATHEAYTGRTDAQHTRNDQDRILGDHEEEPGFFLDPDRDRGRPDSDGNQRHRRSGWGRRSPGGD